jgi:hypothetical protein
MSVTLSAAPCRLVNMNGTLYFSWCCHRPRRRRHGGAAGRRLHCRDTTEYSRRRPDRRTGGPAYVSRAGRRLWRLTFSFSAGVLCSSPGFLIPPASRTDRARRSRQPQGTRLRRGGYAGFGATRAVESRPAASALIEIAAADAAAVASSRVRRRLLTPDSVALFFITKGVQKP